MRPLGNEEGKSDYLSHTIPILTAMRARLQQVSPSAYAKVRFAFAFNDWDSPTGDALASAAYNVTGGAACMTWDQHDGGTNLGDAASAFVKHDQMIRFLREKHNWSSYTPMYIGETNCAQSPELCTSMNRALLYALYTHEAARRGWVGSISPAVWAYSTCNAEGTVCGASDHKTDWPQEALIITPSTVVRQPPWMAHHMQSKHWATKSLAVEPPTSSCPTGTGVVDVLVLKNETGPLHLHVVATCNTAGSLSLSVAGSKLAPCGADSPLPGIPEGAVATEVLSAPLTAFNTVAEPQKVRVVSGIASIGTGGKVVTLALPPYSLTTAVLCLS